MDQLIGALVEMAASAARAGAEPEAAEKLRQRIEALKAQSSGAAVAAATSAQSAQQQRRPQAPAKKALANAPEQPAGGQPAAHVRSPHKRHEEHAPSLVQTFHRRSSLLAALVAVETLGPPPALRPRELRGEVW